MEHVDSVCWNVLLALEKHITTKEPHEATSQVLIPELPCGTAFRRLLAKGPLITQVSGWLELCHLAPGLS